MAADLIGKRKEHALMGWSIPIAAAILELECPACSLRLYQELGFSDSKCRWRGGRTGPLSDRRRMMA